jgi:thioredoxin reductase
LGQEQLARYPSVAFQVGTATAATGGDGSFEVALEGGETVGARKLVLATGVSDELPERPGFRELWGRGVYGCPYCHGWEVRDQPLAVLAAGEEALARAALIRTWSRDLVVLTDGAPGFDEAGHRRLQALGVSVMEARIAYLVGGAHDARSDRVRIVFEDDSELARAGLFLVPPQRQRSNLAESLGCTVEAVGPAKARVVTHHPMTKETTVRGVYVAGDAGSAIQSVVVAAASGATTAYFVNHDLSMQDADAAVAASEGR